MLFSEEDAPELKRWIVKRLEDTSDADADVLADYVLALLRHDGDAHTVRQLCEAEIPDFLKEDSSVFVRDVFDAIHFKSYIPGSAPGRSSQAYASPVAATLNPLGEITMANDGLDARCGTRKRPYTGLDDDYRYGEASAGGGNFNGRLLKQARRASINRRGHYASGSIRRGGPNDHFSPPDHRGIPPNKTFPSLSMMPTNPDGLPYLDPNDAMAGLLAAQAMGLGMPSFQPHELAQSNPSTMHTYNSRKSRCRDYDIKGFCARGNSCQFEHGNDSIFVPSELQRDEYDPVHSNLANTTEIETVVSRNGFNQHSNFRGSPSRGRGALGNSFLSKPTRRSGRAAFSSDRPNHNKNNTTIVVENIPEEKFTDHQVRDFFTEFGEILDISMQTYKRLAIVTYGLWDSANAAYTSPKVIFDNRFVKVYWYTNPGSLPQAVTPNSKDNLKTDSIAMNVTKPETEVQIDLEEFRRRQQEAQRVHEEKARKLQEMEATRKDVEEQLATQAAEKKKILERLATKTGTSRSNSISEGTPQANDKPISQTAALKAQLAALEAEAESLGIDTTFQESSARARGGGRGRSAYRSRGSFVSRAHRGAYRGRGGTLFANTAAYKLDNRTRRVCLTGADFSDPEKDESLRQYLLGVGEYAGIEVTPAHTYITFKDRHTAERFMYGTADGDIPSVGKVELAWAQVAPVASESTSKTPVVESEQNNVQETIGMGQSMSPGLTREYGNEQNESIEYDVADDEHI